MQRYKVTCTQCKKSDHVMIDEKNKRIAMFEGKMLTPLASARWRSDMKWGFECVNCGNYDLLAKEEVKDVDKLVSGSPMRVVQIVEMLKQKPKVRFEMVAV